MVAVNNFQSQPQHRRSPFLHNLTSRYRFSGFLTKAVLTVMTWYLLAFFKKFIYSSVIFHEAVSFACDILKNNVSKADLLRSALWSSALFWMFPPNPPRTSAGERCLFLQPLGPVNVKCRLQFPRCCYQKWPQGGSTPSCPSALFCWLN